MAKIPLLKDFYYTFLGIRLYRNMLKTSCFWTVERMKKYQYEKIKYLLIESYNGIPYYRKLFDDLEFNPKTQFHSLEDLGKLPVLNKEFVKRNKEIFLNKKYSKNSILFRTSGSTGEPFEILVHPNQWILEQGVVWRHWKWGGYDFRDPLAMVRSFVPPNDQILWQTNLISNFTYFSPFHLNDKNMAKYLDQMILKNIVVLRGSPSSSVLT
jgi:phenylacetate-CoA ligase